MNRFLVLPLLLCPLLATAAEWRYDGQLSTPPADEMAAASAGSSMVSSGELRDAPVNNMSMSVVRESYGEPEKVLPPVGEPPITRWEYPGYVVYFEKEQVITSVAGRL